MLRQLYSAALEQCSGDSSAEGANLKATVLTNRAMVLFKQGKVSPAACLTEDFVPPQHVS